ncbi:MAG: phosphoenolpyruvate carboxykinase (ATP) [Pirellulaceae bacterium]|nr:phosphoenolpyruvate carboxykinase (ATP) [Pirellulaceae bacterium]MDP7305864.1 phosphoenolpyruvate carboxykinase (ATP) [Pirellulaceae bacterium]
MNTGWTGGGHGVGSRFDLKHTRAIIDAIHDRSLRLSRSITQSMPKTEVPLRPLSSSQTHG